MCLIPSSLKNQPFCGKYSAIPSPVVQVFSVDGDSDAEQEPWDRQEWLGQLFVLHPVMKYEIIVRALPAWEQMRVPSATMF